ncbi:IstB-like ATP binding protein [Thiothrix caldifontis]|uniref:IstB-like ATP binding protein n=1 Tax=Thiothrix caldifontis TaxID=525918 RepID=A0A1H4BXR0_9GAMM|nr:ATP-binding protein [Thiothrix caldifontis]SEA52864.1 IstB-like ATP binding protein [Thiothrix caldifontis]
MNRNFFICSAGDENKDFGDKNLENCINNKAHIMHRGTAQKGVFNSIKPKDILFLKYNGRLVAYGLSTGREDSEKQDSDGWDFYSYVEEWFFHDNKNPRNGVSNEGVSKYIKEGSGQYGTVKEIELPYAIRKMEEIDNQSLLFKKIKEEVSMSNFKLQILELLDKNKNLILTGAPGAGKTYLAKELAKLITQAEENSSQIASVQFHPSYDLL